MESHLNSTPSRKSLDRRAQRTRQAIKESFVDLMRTRQLQDITVKEVMERADVNRATFYAHFSNLEDLEHAIEADAAERLLQTIEHLRGSLDQPEDELSLIFGCLLQDRELSQWFVGPQASGHGRAILAQSARQRYVPLWSTAGSLTHPQAECLFDFIFNGAFGVLNRWYERREDSARTLAALSSIVGSTLHYAYAQKDA